MRRKLAVLDEQQKERTAAVARSAAMQEVLTLAARVAATPSSSALLIGESGVGKEVVAAYIHEQSERRKGAFVRVNLAAIPETMVEAELFGSVRGAFTDAKRDRAGHFASADGGTILLDEVCEFKPELQPKLLRALEERRFFPVGSDRERRMNVRVIAATHRDPMQMIERARSAGRTWACRSSPPARRRRTPATARSRCASKTSRSATSSRCSSGWAARRPAPRRCSGCLARPCGRRPSGTGSSDRLPDAG